MKRSRSMELFSSQNISYVGDTYQLKSMLERVWNVNTQYPVNEIKLDKRLMQADCVLIDINVSETCSLSIRDIVIQLRLFGYRNVIACLCNEKDDEANLLRELTDVASVDVFLKKPLSTDSLHLLSEKCCEISIQEIFLYSRA